MPANYKLSIIIPHYNTPELLKELLSTIPDSAEIQTIVIDDHSSKEVKQQLRGIQSLYADRPVFFYENNGKHNAGAARNVGLEHAEGEWLFFADADDYFVKGFYEIIHPWLDLSFDVIYFKSTSINLNTGGRDVRHSGVEWHINNYLNHPCRKTEIGLRTGALVPYSKLIRTSLVFKHRICFDEIPVSNDALFSVKTGCYAKTITASDQVVYCITRRPGSLTDSTNLSSFEIRAETEIKVADFERKTLSKKDFHFIARPVALEYLFRIVKRRYGFKVFVKYFRLFVKHHMLLIGLGCLTNGTIRRAIQVAREK